MPENCRRIQLLMSVFTPARGSLKTQGKAPFVQAEIFLAAAPHKFVGVNKSRHRRRGVASVEIS
jgi:hypothetical protein